MRTLLLLMIPAALSAQAPVIDSVVVVTHDIFDSTQVQGNVLAQLMNALHMRTRSFVVRKELLFKAGDLLDPRRLEETERNLRRLGILRAVAVDTVRVDGKLVARVVTYDGWTTSLETRLSFTGDVVTWSAGLNERNVLGTGHLIGGAYRKEVDRDAWRIRTQLNRLAGTPAYVVAFYDNLSDGYGAAWNGGVPYRSLSDRVQVLLPGQVLDARVLQFRDGAASDTLWRRALIQQAEVGWAPVAGPGGYVRLAVFGGVRRQEYVGVADTGLAIPDSVFGDLGISTELARPRYIEVTHYNGFARDEDLDLGSRLTLGAGVALPSLGYTRGGIAPFGKLFTGLGTPSVFAKLGLEAGGLFTSAGLDSGQVEAAFTLASRLIPRQATILHVEAGLQKNPAPGMQFDLGHGVGPRAFKAHAFTGTRAVWGVVEHRVFLWDALFGLLGLGVAGFVDYGGAWYADQPARHGGDVGLGLRSGATSSSGNNVGRLDVAYRFGDGITGSRWVVSFGTAYQF